jgi:hypothetical protein
VFSEHGCHFQKKILAPKKGILIHEEGIFYLGMLGYSDPMGC